MRPAINFLFFLSAFILIVNEDAKAQVQTARFVSMIAHTNAYYEYVPEGYPEPNRKYPLLIFLHGLGEAGPGTPASLPTVLRNGPPKLISQGRFPRSFTVNNVNHKILVISPQFTVWPTEEDLDSVINYLISHYPVDINRVYLTGLSMGGGVVWNYSGNHISHAGRVAAIVPVCGAGYPYPGHAASMAAANLPVWATHNSIDNNTSPNYTINYVNLINAAPVPPNPLAKKTIFTVSSNNHDAWTRTYDTSFRENGMNVYEWMLQFRRYFAVLPVNGLVFNASLLAHNSANLQWSTSGETNVAKYTVQRSTDGVNYSDLTSLNSTGSNGAGSTYSYLDAMMPPGMVYYRLMIVDIDGNRNFSSIKVVNNEVVNTISIYPNPVGQELKISSGSSLHDYNLSIINTSGQVVFKKKLYGTSPYRIDISSLRPGSYHTIIMDNKNRQQFSFIKQ